MKKDFTYKQHLRVDELYKTQINFMLTQKKHQDSD